MWIQELRSALARWRADRLLLLTRQLFVTGSESWASFATTAGYKCVVF